MTPKSAKPYVGSSSESHTIYFVAAVMVPVGGRGPHSHSLHCRTFVVSGNTPLTNEEVIGRFDREQPLYWDTEAFGPLANWMRAATAVLPVPITPS